MLQIYTLLLNNSKKITTFVMLSKAQNSINLGDSDPRKL